MLPNWEVGMLFKWGFQLGIYNQAVSCPSKQGGKNWNEKEKTRPQQLSFGIIQNFSTCIVLFICLPCFIWCKSFKNWDKREMSNCKLCFKMTERGQSSRGEPRIEQTYCIMLAHCQEKLKKIVLIMVVQGMIPPDDRVLPFIKSKIG